jgi:hypothetical protein
MITKTLINSAGELEAYRAYLLTEGYCIVSVRELEFGRLLEVKFKPCDCC